MVSLGLCYHFSHALIILPAACSRPEDLVHGEVVWSDTLTAGIALYTCNRGYQLNGVKQRSCRVTGEWSDTKPSCESE